MAFWTVGPAVEGWVAGFVASEMNVFRREDVGKFLEYVAKKLICELVART